MYNLKNYIVKKYEETSKESDRFYNRTFFNNTKNALFSSTTANLQLIFVYFILLTQALNNTGFTYGDFTVQFNAVNTLSSTLMTIIGSVLAINQMGFYIDDLQKFVELPRIAYNKGMDIEECPTYNFEFVNVCFKYPGSKEYALKNVNVSFSTDQKLSFVGLNGAGKTTFVKLLLRLYDVSSGEILLNGVNIQKYNFNEYIKIFSSVFQDYKLFAYSVQENIVLSEDEPDTARLERALEESGVSNFVEKKENGIHSFVYKIFDASGFEPSGGEGQKIAIARALYKDAKFIIYKKTSKESKNVKNQYQKTFAFYCRSALRRYFGSINMQGRFWFVSVTQQTSACSARMVIPRCMEYFIHFDGNFIIHCLLRATLDFTPLHENLFHTAFCQFYVDNIVF